MGISFLRCVEPTRRGRCRWVRCGMGDAPWVGCSARRAAFRLTIAFTQLARRQRWTTGCKRPALSLTRSRG